MSNRSYPGYRETFSNHVERRLEIVPHMIERKHALELDLHQQEAMLEVAVALQDAHRYKAFSIMHSCGSGKTVLEANLVGASQDAKHEMGVNGDRRDIVLVTERSNLLTVRKQFETLGFTDLGIWGNGERITDRPVILATIQAMQMNRKELAKILPLEKIDLIIGDEADMYLTKDRIETVEKLDGVVRVGFTATGTWKDGRDISELWGPKIHKVPLTEGIKRGINVPPVWKLYESALDEDTLRIKGNDYEPKTLAAAMKSAEIHKAIPEIYETAIERGRRKDFPTLIFVPSTSLVDMVTDTMRKKFGPEGIVTKGWIGENIDSKEMENDMRDFNNRELNALVLCEMGGRGVDLPAARFLIDAYPTLSPTKLEQRHGRPLRRVRMGSPLYQSGFRKDYSIIVQIHPMSNAFRPICLPDILDGETAWETAKAGNPLGLKEDEGDVGASWGDEVAALQRRIESKNPTINVSLVKELDVYRHIRRFEDIPQADESGFIYLPKDYGKPKS